MKPLDRVLSDLIPLPFELPPTFWGERMHECPVCHRPMEFIGIHGGGFGLTLDGFIFLPTIAIIPVVRPTPEIAVEKGLRACGIEMVECIGREQCGTYYTKYRDDQTVPPWFAGKKVDHSFWTWRRRESQKKGNDGPMGSN